MSYLIERAAEIHRNDLLKEAQLVRQSRVFAGDRSRVRRPIGRFLVRLGNRLSEEPRHAPRLAGVVGEPG